MYFCGVSVVLRICTSAVFAFGAGSIALSVFVGVVTWARPRGPLHLSHRIMSLSLTKQHGVKEVLSGSDLPDISIRRNYLTTRACKS